MEDNVKIKCITDLSKENIDINSTDYLLEYLPVREKENEYEYVYIMPPLLMYSNKVYKPIFGSSIINKQLERYNRIKLAISVYSYPDDSSLFKFLLFLKKNYLGLNPVEKSIFLKKFENIMGEEIYKNLEIPKNSKFIEGYKKLLYVSDKIKNHVVKSEINESVLFEIFSLFEEKDWDIIEDFVIKLKIGTKKRIEIVNIIYDIIQRDKLSLISLIESDEINQIMNLKIDFPQKGEKIFDLLYSKRYPEIYNYKKRFYKNLRSLNLSKDIRITIPSNFERWEFGVNFNFKDIDDFKNRLNELQSVIKNEDFEKLLNMRY